MNATETKPTVGVIAGSDSDWPLIEPCIKVLDDMGIGVEVRILSAHRSPAAVEAYVGDAADRGLKVLIAIAGLSAHLAGVSAAKTDLPVIGVPADAGSLGGLDALLSTVQMPPGVPVATVAIGGPGARNAAYLAVRILALSDETLRAKLSDHRAAMARGVAEKDARLQQRLAGDRAI